MVRIANVLINAIFKHACAATEYSQKPKNWHEQSSTSINWVCDQLRLRRDCASLVWIFAARKSA